MVNIYKIELTNLQQSILRLLFVNAGISLNQHQISKNLDVSPPAVMKALPKLEKYNLIKINQEKESRRWAIELNKENHKAMQLKRVDNLKQIYESGLSDFLEEEFPGTSIVLFGSYSRGDDTEKSDIDIAIVGGKGKTIDFSKYEAILKREINVNFYGSWDKIHKNLKENICNGIILVGGIEL